MRKSHEHRLLPPLALALTLGLAACGNTTEERAATGALGGAAAGAATVGGLEGAAIGGAVGAGAGALSEEVLGDDTDGEGLLE